MVVLYGWELIYRINIVVQMTRRRKVNGLCVSFAWCTWWILRQINEVIFREKGLPVEVLVTKIKKENNIWLQFCTTVWVKVWIGPVWDNNNKSFDIHTTLHELIGPHTSLIGTNLEKKCTCWFQRKMIVRKKVCSWDN